MWSCRTELDSWNIAGSLLLFSAYKNALTAAFSLAWSFTFRTINICYAKKLNQTNIFLYVFGLSAEEVKREGESEQVVTLQVYNTIAID